MRKSTSLIGRCLTAFLIAIVSVPALGAAQQRSFVASTGDDSGACTLIAPCRTFARAITQTNVDGEIIVLDSAGYGHVVVDKSVAIIAPAGVYAGVSVFAGDDGIEINGSGINVVLRGLAINGQGGNRGIFYTFGSSLRVENCVVSNMASHGISIGWGGGIVIADTVIRGNGGAGIRVSLDAKVVVERTRIEGNTGDGIRLVGSPFSAQLAVRDCLIARNTNHGISAGGSGGAGSDVTLTGTTLTGNNQSGVAAFSSDGESIRLFAQRNIITKSAFYGFWLIPTGSGTITATLTDNLISGSSVDGIQLSLNPGAIVVLDRNTVTENQNAGLFQNGGEIRTRGNNTVRLNGADVSGTLTPIGGT